MCVREGVAPTKRTLLPTPKNHGVGLRMMMMSGRTRGSHNIPPPSKTSKPILPPTTTTREVSCGSANVRGWWWGGHNWKSFAFLRLDPALSPFPGWGWNGQSVHRKGRKVMKGAGSLRATGQKKGVVGGGRAAREREREERK
jgi:hypothetical protein